MSTWFSDRWVVGYQNFCSLSIKAIFLPQNMLSWAHIGLAGSFGALLVCWLVVVVRGLYLARHLFTLLISLKIPTKLELQSRSDHINQMHKASVSE